MTERTRRFKIGDMVQCIGAASPLWENHYYRVIAVGWADDGRARIGVSADCMSPPMFPNSAPWDEHRFVLAPRTIKETSRETRRVDYSSVTKTIVMGD